ncbi:MAG: hypothetical protein OEZ02_07260 [Anaerolineae bacterium]|nr:hypothetical protein [Anaerolineae bacterium]
MNMNLTNTAAVIAFVIGGLSVFAGSMVVMGKTMDYNVIDWLPIYNLIAGLITVLFTAILIWQGNRFAMIAAVVTLLSHSVVLLILKTNFRDVVAMQSIRAMIFRIAVWLVIILMMSIQIKQSTDG